VQLLAQAVHSDAGPRWPVEDHHDIIARRQPSVPTTNGCPNQPSKTIALDAAADAHRAAQSHANTRRVRSTGECVHGHARAARAPTAPQHLANAPIGSEAPGPWHHLQSVLVGNEAVAPLLATPAQDSAAICATHAGTEAVFFQPLTIRFRCQAFFHDGHYSTGAMPVKATETGRIWVKKSLEPLKTVCYNDAHSSVQNVWIL